MFVGQKFSHSPDSEWPCLFFSLMAGVIAGLLAGEGTDNCVRMGLVSANLSLRSYEPISPEINATSVSVATVKAQSWLEGKTQKLP